MKKTLKVLSVTTLLGASLAQAPMVLAEEFGQDEGIVTEDTQVDGEVNEEVEVDESAEGEQVDNEVNDLNEDENSDLIVGEDEETSDDEGYFIYDPDEYSPAIVELVDKIHYIGDGFRVGGTGPGIIFGDLDVIFELGNRERAILESDLSDDEKLAQLQEVYDDTIVELKNAHGDNYDGVMYLLTDEGRDYIDEVYGLIDQLEDSQLREEYLYRQRDYFYYLGLPNMQALEEEVKSLLNADSSDPTPSEPEPDQEPSQDPNDSDPSDSKVIVNTEVHGLPNDVRQVFDDQLAEGELVVDVIGVPGLVEVTTYADGSTAEHILEEPVERVERVGTNKDLAKSESQEEAQADAQEVKEASSQAGANQAAASKGEKLPETGEVSSLASLAMGGLSLLAGLGFTFKKKEN